MSSRCKPELKPTFGKPATCLTQRKFGRPQSGRPRRVRKTGKKKHLEINRTACRAGSWLCLASVSEGKTPRRWRQGQTEPSDIELFRVLLKPCKKFGRRTMRTWSSRRRSRPHGPKRKKTTTKGTTGRKHEMTAVM